MQAIEAKSSRTKHVPTELVGLTIVALSDGGRNFGLYRVKQAEARTMLLGHGAIAFPEGMHLDIEDFKYLVPNSSSFHQRATVVGNGREGILLTW